MNKETWRGGLLETLSEKEKMLVTSDSKQMFSQSFA